MQNCRQFTFSIAFSVMMLALVSSPVMALAEVQQGAQLESEGLLYYCSISPDGSHAAVGGQSTQIVKIYNAATGTLTGTGTLPAGVETEDLELSNSGNRIFVGGQGSGLYCFNKSGAMLWSRPAISGELSVGTTAIGNLVFTVDRSDSFYRISGATGANLIAPVPVDTRGWSVWEVDTTADGGDRVLIMTNSDVIITDGFGTETHFYDIVTGNYIHEAHLSPDGSYFAVVFLDPDTSIINVSLYEIGVGEKWTIETSNYTNVCMDDNNRVYVATSYGDNVVYNTTGTEITRWYATGKYFDVADDGSRCVAENGTSTYVYDFVGMYECYPDLHLQAYLTDVAPFDADTQRYTLTIANWYDIPPELFVSSPELPACGQNDRAGRTYIRILGSEGSLYFSGCGARGDDGTSSEFLKRLTFLVDDGELDEYIYLELWDRKCDLYLRSTYAYSGKPCPVGDLDGDCIVNLKDFALMAENWLVDNNP